MKESPVKSNASVGIVLATHGSLPYLHLHLECLKRHEPDVRVLIHDDSSDQEQELRAMAKEYRAEFHCTPFRLKPTLGDLSAFSQGLQWGDREGLDVVVKCSRSFIANRPWSRELVNLMHNTGYATATAPCATFNFGFRSEWTALHVRSWIDSGTMQEMQGYVDRNQEYGFAEAYHHNKAREVHKFVHPYGGANIADTSRDDMDWTLRSEHYYARPENYNGYIPFFGLLGLGRSQPVTDILWHDISVNSDYGQLARSLGLDYADESFQRVHGE